MLRIYPLRTYCLLSVLKYPIQLLELLPAPYAEPSRDSRAASSASSQEEVAFYRIDRWVIKYFNYYLQEYGF